MIASRDQTLQGQSSPTRGRGFSNLSDTACLGFMLLAAALPYVNILLNDFTVTYDDGTQILKNPYVHSLGHLREIFGTNVWSYLSANTVTNYFRPMMTLGFLLCYKFFGPLAYGFHLTSLALHVATVGFLFLVTRRMIADRAVAAAASLVFAVHPAHTEAVDWISAVTELELAVFFLAAFWFYLGTAKPAGGCSAGAVFGMAGCCVLALLAKEQAMALPFVAAVYEHFYREDRGTTRWGQKVARYGALWLLAIGYVAFRMYLFGRFAPLLQRPRLGWGETVLVSIALFGQYVGKLIWPAQLLTYYPLPEDIRALALWMVVGGMALVAGLAFLVRLWKRSRLATFGTVWMLATLAPVLNARWMASNVFGERYLYLPSVGFCWLIGWGWAACWNAPWARRAGGRAALSAVAGVLCAIGLVRIVTRNRDWRDDVTLYKRTLEITPANDRVLEALGLAYWNRGEIDAAEQTWRRLLALKPASPSTWNFLGTALARKKQFPEAVASFERSLRLDPDSPDAHINLGAAFAEQGRMAEAAEQFRAALALSPLNAPAHNVLGKIYLDEGRLEEAAAEFRASLEVEPNVAAFDHLGYICLRRGDVSLAERLFRQALAINPSDSGAHFSLAGIYADAGRAGDAVHEYAAGLAVEPENAAAQAALDKLKTHAEHTNSERH